MRKWDDYKKTMIPPETVWVAAKSGDLPVLSRLLDAGADIEARDSRGYSALMHAAYAGNLEMVRFLLARGANPDSPDAAGNSALMGVSFKGHLEVARALLEAGANANHRNHAKMDAHDYATTFGRRDIVQLLQSSVGTSRRSGNRLWSFVKIAWSRIMTAAPRTDQLSERKNRG